MTGIVHVRHVTDLRVDFIVLTYLTGILLKRSTCLYTTKDRLKLIQQFLQKVLVYIGVDKLS